MVGRLGPQVPLELRIRDSVRASSWMPPSWPSFGRSRRWATTLACDQIAQPSCTYRRTIVPFFCRDVHRSRVAMHVGSPAAASRRIDVDVDEPSRCRGDWSGSRGPCLRRRPISRRVPGDALGPKGLAFALLQWLERDHAGWSDTAPLARLPALVRPCTRVGDKCHADASNSVDSASSRPTSLRPSLRVRAATDNVCGRS